MKEILEQERVIDREIMEELEKYKMEREIGGLDLEDSANEQRFVEQMGIEDYEITESNLAQMHISNNSMDTSMISASGASSSSQNIQVPSIQPNPNPPSNQAGNHPVRQRSSIGANIRR